MSTFERADTTGQVWKVGELARATGLTVRALHYYEEIGLLLPSRRSSAGHRLYDGTDVARLYRVNLLRGLGFPLEQIRSALEDPQWQLAAAANRHLQHTHNRAAIATRLCARLTTMAAELARQDNPPPEQLFTALEEMTMLDGTIHSTTGLLVYRVIGLHPASSKSFRSPNSIGGVTGMTVIAVTDADAHYARSVEAGAEIACELVDQPYGIREYGARDPEGQLWYFQSPLS